MTTTLDLSSTLVPQVIVAETTPESSSVKITDDDQDDEDYVTSVQVSPVPNVESQPITKNDMITKVTSPSLNEASSHNTQINEDGIA